MINRSLLGCLLLAGAMWLSGAVAWAEPITPPGVKTTDRAGYESMPAVSANLGIGWAGLAAGDANLRQGPSTDYPVSGQLQAGGTGTKACRGKRPRSGR